MYEILLTLGNFFCQLGNFFCRLAVLFSCHLRIQLRLGAQSTLRDPTQLRQRQWATRQQHPFFSSTLLSSLKNLILEHLIRISYRFFAVDQKPKDGFASCVGKKTHKFFLLIRRKKQIEPKKVQLFGKKSSARV